MNSLEASSAPDDERHAHDMSKEDLAIEGRQFLANGWQVEDIDGDKFNLFSPVGSAFHVSGIRIALDGDAPDFEMLSESRQKEELDAERLCELVVQYRFKTGQLLGKE